MIVSGGDIYLGGMNLSVIFLVVVDGSALLWDFLCVMGRCGFFWLVVVGCLLWEFLDDSGQI